MTVRRLLVVRHAKSAWPVGVPDRERPLKKRGIRDAPVMGARIGELVGRVDTVVVSPARRAVETWELMSSHVPHGQDVREDARVYDAWGAQMMDVVMGLPDSSVTALLVGHEPGVSELVLTLASMEDRELRSRVGTKFPTCSLAVLRSDRSWGSFRAGCAQLERFTTPRD